MPVARHTRDWRGPPARPPPRSTATTPAGPKGSSANQGRPALRGRPALQGRSLAEVAAAARAGGPGLDDDVPELPPPPTPVERFVLPVVWVLVVALVSAGAAGMLSGMDHPPGTAGRAELTWETDRALAPAIDLVARDLTAMSLQVDQLSDAGRQVLVAVSNRDSTTLSQALAGGSALEAVVVEQALEIHAKLEALPVGGAYAALRVSPLQLARHKAALQAVDATQGIEAAWSTLVNGATTANRLGALMVNHDAAVAKAAGQGVAQQYAAAVASVGEAKAIMTQIRTLRNQLAAATDVSTLDQWISLSAAYEDALQALYQAFIAGNGRVTQDVARAFTAEQAARAKLPPDDRSLVVIMAELSQGGLNQAVIAIDTAGQGLAHALESMPGS